MKTIEDFEMMNFNELKKIARELKLELPRTIKKAELVSFLFQLQQIDEEPEPEKKPAEVKKSVNYPTQAEVKAALSPDIYYMLEINIMSDYVVFKRGSTVVSTTLKQPLSAIISQADRLAW